MFLKRIEIQGFKSFADKTIIAFDRSITGIVGPNGCGKSNIADAIRWVLGEQSAKSLRSSVMNDVIFSGSQYRSAVNVAEVKLVFDNTKRRLNVGYDEVEITRRLHRNTNEGQYFINKAPCRLKDITDLLMDSGIGKDSLSLITQGNIQAFADSKAEDRRPLFEEAAGVSKYKKRKLESLRKLERTEDNLTRIDDILLELEERVTGLEKQAKKAKKYLEKSEKLKHIEISVIVDEIDGFQAQIEKNKNESFDLNTQKIILQAESMNLENENEAARKELATIDASISKLQENYVHAVNEISSLEARKVELDEKRKYALTAMDRQSHLEELKSMLRESEYEYNDRKQRMSDLQKAFDELNEKARNLYQEINELNIQDQHNQATLNRLTNRKEVLEQLMKQPYTHQQGVQAIMQANPPMEGILGIVNEIFHVEEGYEQAISNALGASLYYIVTKDNASARHAIAYLKKNQSGRATFLPLTVLKERYLGDDDLFLCQHCEGFLGCADEFVSCASPFELVKSSLLGNVLVTDQLKHANELARMLKYRYRIVTLDGDLVNRGGSMTGGKTKDRSPLTISNEYEQCIKRLNRFEATVKDVQNQLANKQKLVQSYNEQLLDKRLAIANLEPLLDVKKAKYEKTKDEIEALGITIHQDDSNQTDEDDLVVQLSKLYATRDDTFIELRSQREKRAKIGQENEQRDRRIRENRRSLSYILTQEKELEVELAKIETNLKHSLERLGSTYELTYEKAKEESQGPLDIHRAKEDVKRLRNEIQRLGNVNLDAPQEFEEVDQRYRTLMAQREELRDAKAKIMDAIEEMDATMSRQFKEMFDKINVELDETFKMMFGGGKAKLYLSDPKNILDSGIEIDAQPPGKSIKVMQQLSGGEKSMLAMCVLFAILKARTVPLCIFDEVEAALDQSNVERFAKYISKYRGDTQFLIVTHRSGTMSECDALYGITMMKDGVSRLLRVNLEDALRYVQNDEGEIDGHLE